MKFSFLFFLFPLHTMAQDITGVWTGTLYNDTTKQYLKYELAISEYDGKLSGYSHTIFVIDKVENIGVKSVKIKKSGNDYYIEDEKLIYNNYTQPPAKGVRTFSKLELSENDTAMMLNGSWKTNRTSHYSSITGAISLYKKKEIQQSLIIPKLEELGVAKSLSFMNDRNAKQSDIAVNDVKQINKESSAKDFETGKKELNKNEVIENNKTHTNTDTSTANNIRASNKNLLTTALPKPVKKESQEDIVLNDKTTKASSIVSKNKIASLQAKQKIISASSGENAIETSKVEIAKIHLPAADIDSRTIETVKSVNIKNDSLVLTLYDNGEIDGDTVSVLLNGNVIWPLQGLTARGNSKTIYLTPEMGDSLELIMYAENLGSIPPNTGLLVVHDGDNAYEIRFSGDLQKNAAIILRRNKK